MLDFYHVYHVDYVDVPFECTAGVASQTFEWDSVWGQSYIYDIMNEWKGSVFGQYPAQYDQEYVFQMPREQQ